MKSSPQKSRRSASIHFIHSFIWSINIYWAPAMAGPGHQGCSGKKSCLLGFTVRVVLRNVSILWRLGKKGSQEEQGPVVWTSLEAKWEGRDGEEESWEGRGTDEGGGKRGTEQGFVSVQSPAFFFPTSPIQKQSEGPASQVYLHNHSNPWAWFC